MTMTLWRGERQLGELFFQYPPYDQVLDAVLIPANGPLDFGVVIWQIYFPGEDRDWIQQMTHEELMAKPGKSNFGVLLPATEEEARNPPAELWFTIRDADGASRMPASLRIHQKALTPGRVHPELAALPGEAFQYGCLWLVHAQMTPHQNS